MTGMSDANRRPLMLNGMPLHTLIERRIPAMARELVEAFAAEIPLYRQLPAEALYGEVFRVTEHNLAMIAGIFRHNRPPTAAELALPRASAGRRAQEMVPLEAILSAYHLGARRLWTKLFGDAGPDDFDDIAQAYSLVLMYTQEVTSAVCAGYTAERELMLSQEQNARHSVVSALLNGERPSSAGTLAGVRLASRYLVLTVALGEHPDEETGESAAGFAGRRKLGRLRTALEEFAADPVLSVLDSGGGLIMVPFTDSSMDWKRAQSLVAGMAQAADVALWAAGELADLDEVAPAARLTQEVLDVLRSFGYAPGLYQLSDVLLEYQLTRPSKATDALAGLLDPLDGNPDLLHTIEVHLENGLDRRRTAAKLHIHPNTVDYRLRRLVQLTGLDPVNSAHLQRIGAALASRRRSRF